MNVPTWLLRIIVSHLSNRKISIRYRKHASSSRNMPGGTAAGTLLGLNLFLIYFNKAGPAANPVTIGQHITVPFNRRKPIDKMKVKWIDDMTVCTFVDLKSSLVPEDRLVPRPRPYHSQTEHRLPRLSNPMQDELDKLIVYTENHLMAFNKIKTKALLCNTRVK